MTRKDYEALAALVADVKSQARSIGYEALAYRLADILAADNSRFDKVKFLQACGVDA